VGQGCRAGQIIDGHEFDIRIAESGTEHVAAYTAKAIDANLYCHILWDLLERRSGSYSVEIDNCTKFECTKQPCRRTGQGICCGGNLCVTSSSCAYGCAPR